MNLAQHSCILILKLYQRVFSPLKGVLGGGFSHCRFQPTCSSYAMESIARHGALLGCLLAFKRLLRCHPWGGYGPDPVPRDSSLMRELLPARLSERLLAPVRPRRGSRFR